MGEYAKSKVTGESVKIGTCENMYYVRYEDRNLFEKELNSLDPNTEQNLRWRLPYPDEDEINAGYYEDAFRALPLNDKFELVAVKNDSKEGLKPVIRFFDSPFDYKRANWSDVLPLCNDKGMIKRLCEYAKFETKLIKG